ncbi:recombinase family protein [Ochrobactrum sp. EDr1-4]|uniref:recombinase family protein n=1 Tax=Ochrobactrum sp. EDr1-4 TaxID=3368622 RepID=UPI003BA22E7B
MRRIFLEFANGIGTRTIARTLNEEGVSGPAGKLWNDTTIRGHVKLDTTLINNELYIGRLIWNRLRYIKDPSSGKRVSRLNPKSDWIIKDVPELRIVDDALWHAVRARQGEIAKTFIHVTEAIRNHHKQNRLNGTRRPKSLLSGLVTCGICQGSHSLRGLDRFVCSNHISKGTCTNSRTIARSILEARVLAGLERHIMTLEIVEAITNVMYHQSMKQKMDLLETRKAELTALLVNLPDGMPDILPSASAIYRMQVTALKKSAERSRTTTGRLAATSLLN